MNQTNGNLWIEKWKSNPQAKARLFCFPHVGASAMIYRTWGSSLPEDIELIAVELPGRGRRFGESAFHSMSDLIPAMSEGLQSLLDKPFFLFGHSMGALIAYEWTFFLEQKNQKLPEAIFLSAFGAPHLPARPRKVLHRLSDEDFLEELRRLKGTPPEVLQHQELMQLLLPMIRADLEIVENYQYASLPRRVSSPLYALGASQDEEVELPRLEAWKDLTSSEFKMKLFEGDHFYIQNSRLQVLEYLTQEISKRMQHV